MRKWIKVKFADMWGDFTPFKYGLWRYLEEKFPVVLSADPDFLIFSVFGEQHLRYDCKKIFISHEAAYPDFRWCDYAVTFTPDIGSRRHLQLPNFPVSIGYRSLERLQEQHREAGPDLLAAKTRFCAYLASNGKARPRERIVDALSEYRAVDCGGKHRNNIGGIISGSDHIDFLQSAKFAIACENSLTPGYVTEKIVLALLAQTIPIYWGDEFVRELFNPARFINARNFDSPEALRAHVEAIDKSDERYLDILRRPCFRSDDLHPCLRRETLLRFFEAIFSGEYENEPKPALSDSDYGALKGARRRMLQAPMTPEEIAAFSRAREDAFGKELLETKYDPALMERLSRLSSKPD